MRFLLAVIALAFVSVAQAETPFVVTDKTTPNYVVTNKTPKADCGCAYSAVPNGLLGSPCTCNPSGSGLPCICGDQDDGPNVPVKRGQLPPPPAAPPCGPNGCQLAMSGASGFAGIAAVAQVTEFRGVGPIRGILAHVAERIQERRQQRIERRCGR